MEQIASLFRLFAIGGAILIVLAAIGMVLYFRWKASGQERGM